MGSRYGSEQWKISHTFITAKANNNEATIIIPCLYVQTFP